MNNRVFIILLLVLAACIGGWIYYTTTQAVSAEPIEEISTKWWTSAHADITRNLSCIGTKTTQPRCRPPAPNATAGAVY